MQKKYESFCESFKNKNHKGKYAKAHPTKLNKVIIQQIKDDRKTGMTETELMNKYHISKPHCIGI